MSDEKDRQIAELQKRLGAANAEQSSGWAGLFSLVGSVVNLVPRWLVVSAGLVFVAWAGAEMYLNVQLLNANKEKAISDALRAKVEADRAPLIVQSEINRAKADALKAQNDAATSTEQTSFLLSHDSTTEELAQRVCKRADPKEIAEFKRTRHKDPCELSAQQPKATP